MRPSQSGDHVRHGLLARPAELYRRQAQEAIYSENAIIERVRVHGVYCNGWGVEVRLSTIPNPGLVTTKEHKVVGVNFTVGCCWGKFYTGRSDWNCSVQGCWWQLVFDPQLIREVVQLGTSLHDRGANRFERLRTLRKVLSQSRIRALEAEGDSTSRKAAE